MAPNTAIAFILSGALLWSTSTTGSRAARWARVLLFALVLVAGTGLLGLWLRTPLTFNGAYTRMALPTAIGLMILAVGLWNLWTRHSGGETTEQAITRTAVYTLIVGVLIAGLAVFVALARQTETSIALWLEQQAHMRVVLFQEALTSAREANDALAEDIGLALAAESAGTSTPLVFTRLPTAWGVHAMTVLASDGTTRMTHGVMTTRPQLSGALDAAGQDRVLWGDTLMLQSRLALRDAVGTPRGTLIVERALPRLVGQIGERGAFGRTGEVRLCVASGAGRASCIPNGVTPGVLRDIARISNGHSLPISLALDGKRGVVQSRDYRNVAVLAAYEPVVIGALALVVQQDSAEIFAPIRQQMAWVLVLLGALSITFVMFVRRRVRPLAQALSRSEADSRLARDQLTAVVDSMSDALLISNASSRITFANAAAERTFGHERGALVGRPLRSLMPEKYRAAHAAGMARHLADGSRRVIGAGRVELEGLRQDGSEFPIELAVESVAGPDGMTFVGVVRDVTEQHEAQRALQVEKERLRVTLHSIGDAVLTTDTDGLVTYINPVCEHLLGRKLADVLGRPSADLFTIVHDGSGVPAVDPVATVLLTNVTSGLADETLLVRPDGTRVAIEDSAAPIRDPDGNMVGVVLVFHDVTEARVLSSRITHQAMHDSLTELVNRRGFEMRLAEVLDTPSLQDKGHVLFYVDLDQFKVVNDTCGHAAGDELLKQVALLFRGALRDNDLLARLGGDEFGVLLRNCPVDAALRVAEKMRAAVDAYRFQWNGRSFGIGASIGVVPFEAGATMAHVLGAGDTACYLAKDKGRNRVHLHDMGDVDTVKRSGELGWAARLHSALEHGRFVLHAQQIVPVTGPGDDPLHFEVLVRMLDEDGGLIPPMSFIPAAERYGLMPQLDRWVVDHALASLAAAQGPSANTCLSINLSGCTLSDDTFIEFVSAAFERHQVAHAQVCFEITETAAIANLLQAERFIDCFKDRGCRFSLDDFGSGMSSFGYLKRLRVDYLKIDGGFVRNLLNDPVDDVMVTAIRNVGFVMGLATVAEFVETTEILDRLREIGVDYAQGYGVHRPQLLSEVL